MSAAAPSGPRRVASRLVRGPSRLVRGAALLAVLVLAVLAATTGCGGPAIESIGRPGTGDGEFLGPRGIAVSERGLAVLDKTGRMQFFGIDGHWRHTTTVVPGDVRRGLPTGVVWLPDGDLAVAHTHTSRIVIFGEDGSTRRVLGDYGIAPGQFIMPQRIALDADGDYVVSEYGIDKTNRVQILRPDGTVVRVLGGGVHGEGGLGRPMGAVGLPGGRMLVADELAGLVVFGPDGHALGGFGPALPEGALPRGVCLGAAGDVYMIDGSRCELRHYGPDGALLGVYGSSGDAPLLFREPWDVAWFDGRVYVADMGNHRVARIDPDRLGWKLP